MFGRRGEIVWKKAGFLGTGGRRDYDTYQGWRFLFPLYLGQPIHTFGWGKDGESALAIPLRRDRGFRLRTYISDWCGPLCLIAGLAFFPIFCSGQSVGLRILTFAVLVITGAGVLFTFLTSGGRDRDIRLILGSHFWGTSDPATWHEDLLEDVIDPEEKFDIPSFEQLAESSLEKGQWAEAMWAARLCAAIEDEETGEALTDEILAHPKVQKRLMRVRRNPLQRKGAFGDPIPLSRWVRGDLKEPIFQVSGW